MAGNGNEITFEDLVPANELGIVNDDKLAADELRPQIQYIATTKEEHADESDDISDDAELAADNFVESHEYPCAAADKG